MVIDKSKELIGLYIDKSKHEYKFTRSLYYVKKANGKTKEYPICCRCGRIHRTDGGFKLDYDLDDTSATIEMKLCKKCARRYQNIFNNIFDEIQKIKREISSDEFDINLNQSKSNIKELNG